MARLALVYWLQQQQQHLIIPLQKQASIRTSVYYIQTWLEQSAWLADDLHFLIFPLSSYAVVYDIHSYIIGFNTRVSVERLCI